MSIAPLALLIAQLLFSPAPTPTLPPEIIHTVTTAGCTTLRKLSLPVGYVTKHNDFGFEKMAYSVRKFFQGITPSDAPTLDELNRVTYTPPDMQMEQMNNQGGTSSVPSDDQLLYGPGQILSAAAVDRVAMQIFDNLVLEDKLMNQSYQEYPKGSDPKVDALRQRAQNLIDLQRSLANYYEEFAGSYLDDQGLGQLQRTGGGLTFKMYLRALLLGEAGSLASSADEKPTIARQDASLVAHLGDVASVVQELRSQEQAFVPDVVALYNQCRGTHYVLATPAPHASPK